VLVFTFVWNDYFWALVLVQSDAAKPLTLGLAGLKGEWLTAWNLISAGALFSALPPVVLFFFMQKHFVAGLTAGAVRG
jgi:multiple sugar transport system permease protein